MVFQVIVHAFSTPCLREVFVPPTDLPGDTDVIATLEAIFKYGQNDFQPRKCPSVSVGDFILLDGDVYMVDNFGFKKLERVK